MQILTGNRYDNTMLEWHELLEKAEARLAVSKECQERFGDHDEWVELDQAKVDSIKKKMLIVEQRMRERGLKPSSELV